MVLFTIFLLSLCINISHFQSVQISVDEFHGLKLHKNNELRSSKFSAVDTSNGRNNSDKEPRRPDQPEESGGNSTHSSDILDVIEQKWKLPETKDHLISLSLSSKVDVEDLGMYLANKSASVYRPGTVIDMSRILYIPT